MRSRSILLRQSVAAVIAVASLLMSAHVANADGVTDQKNKVNQLADQLDNLENRLGQLDEEYGAAQDKKAGLDQEIADSEVRIAQQEARLGELQGVLGDIAVDKYVTGSSLELSPLFSTAESYTAAEEKDSLSRLALDSGSSSTDEELALAEDLAKEQASLSRKQGQVADLVTMLNSKLAEAQTLQGEFTQKLSSAKAELGDLIAQERERRAEAAAAVEIAKQKQAADDAVAAAAAAAAAAADAASKSAALASSARGGGTVGGNAGGTVAGNAGGGTVGGGTVGGGTGGGSGGAGGPVGGSPAPPPVSSRAGTAVNAAYGQLGVPYLFAAESPGVAFDCSGLTKYAWGQAGVSLPHQSGAQYASIPHISQADAQPGDLIFYKSPIGHVAMYIGGGSLIQATRPGDVVKVAAVNWSVAVGVGRPG